MDDWRLTGQEEYMNNIFKAIDNLIKNDTYINLNESILADVDKTI